MQQHARLREEDARTEIGEDLRLPQTFVDRDQPHEVPTSARLAYALEEVERRVRKATIELLAKHGIKRSESDIAKLSLVESVGPLSDIRNKTGFRLSDYAAAEEGSNDRVDIVSVEIRKVPGRRGVIVPIIHPHSYPGFDLGDEIRTRIYREYEKELGSPPPELIRSRTERAWENFVTWIKEHKAAVIAMFVLAAGTGGGIRFQNEIKTGINDMQVRYEQYQKDRAEAIRMEQAQKAAAQRAADLADRSAREAKALRVIAAVHAAQDKSLFYSILAPVSYKDFNALARQFSDSSIPQQQRLSALKTFGTLGELMRAYHPAEVNEDNEIVSGVARDHMLKLLHDGLVDNSQELRHTAADVFRQIELARN